MFCYLPCFTTLFQVPLRVDGLAKITKSAIDEGASPILLASHERGRPHIFIFFISLVVAERGVPRSRPARDPLAPVPTPAR